MSSTSTRQTGRYCGNDDCCASSGICGRITFGHGELDNNGYWEYPCVICAATAVRHSSYSPDEVWPSIEGHEIPDWAGQATPGAQLTCIRSAIEMTVLNVQEGITPPEQAQESMGELIDQLKKLEQHLQFKGW